VITSLGISGFRGIKNCRIDDLSEISLFIGRNNSGKSSILEALYLASAAFNETAPISGYATKIDYLLNRRCERNLRWNTGQETLWPNYETKIPIKIELNLNQEKLEMSLFNWHHHPLLRLSTSLMEKLASTRTSIPILELPHMNHVCLLDGSLANLKYQTFSGIPWASLSEMLDEDLKGKFYQIRSFMDGLSFVDSSLIHRMENVEKALWNRLLKERLDKLVTSVLKQGYDVDIEDLTYVPSGDTYQLAVKLPKTTIRMDDLGDGARYATVLVMMAALAKDTALLIEEPESHQHPGGLVKTLNMLLSLAKQNHIQIFASTHSVEFIKIAGEIADEKNVRVKIFFLERDKEGNVEARSMSPEDASVLEKLGLDARFLDIM